MNYKKMLAAAAVTSAAIVVPVAVQAASQEVSMFGEATDVHVDSVLTITDLKDAAGNAVNVDTVKWYIVESDGTENEVGNDEKYTIPLEASDKTIKVVVKAAGDGTLYDDDIKVNAVQNVNLFGTMSSVNFNDVVNITPPVVDGQTISMSSVKWYVESNGVVNLASEEASYKVAYEDLGKNLKAVAKASDGTVYTYTIPINPLSNMTIPFNEIDDETNELTPVTTATINKQLSADLTNLSGTITKYEWFIKDGTKTSLVEHENDMLINVPLLAAGKELMLVVTKVDGSKHYTTLSVEPFTFPTTLDISVKLNGKEIDFTNPNLSLAPNDVLEVGEIDFESMNLLPSQVNISYEWYFTKQTNDPSSLIPDAVSSSFTIPSDAFIRSLNNFKAIVKLEIPALNIKSDAYESDLAILNIQPAKDVEAAIKALVKNNQYELLAYADLTAFETELKTMQANYDALSTNSKSLVTNYAVLQTALADLAAVKPLVKELEAFRTAKAAYDVDKTAGKHTEIVQKFAAIEKKYNQLTRLQLSLLDITEFNNGYVETMINLLKNSNDVNVDDSLSSDKIKTTYEAVEALNADILALINEDIISNTYNVTDTREEFAKTVQQLLDRSKTIDKTFQPILYTSILKAAQSDLKKATSAAEKINKVTKLTGTKKVSAAASAKSAVTKLTSLQHSLLTEDELLILATLEDNEAQKVASLVDAIDEVLENGQYKLDGFQYEFTSDKQLEAVPAILLEQYKALSSDSRKLVTNYAKISLYKKDIKAAQKVMEAISNATIADEAIDDTSDKTLAKTQRAAFTKYRTAYKAYVKLTPQQRSIVDEHATMKDIDFSFPTFTARYEALSDELNIPIEDDTSDSDTETDDDPVINYEDGNVRNVISLLKTLEESVSTSVTSLEDVQAQIANIKVAYSQLKSAEKKNVYNYSSLSTANAVANKAKSMKKKLDSAIASNDVKKITSALEAFEKLTTPQQLLLEEEETTAREKLEELRGNEPNFEDLAAAIQNLAEEPNLEEFNELEEAMKGLTSKELKKIPNYKLYQAIVKDKKAVEKFIAKIVKLGDNPSYSKKEGILKDYNKLTARQQAFAATFYLESDPDFNLEALFVSWENKDANAIALNDEIGSILVAGKYSVSNPDVTVNNLDDFYAYLEQLEEKISALDSKEKKLITHKNFIKTAEKDAKAVKAVLETAQLFEDAATSEQETLYTQWERAYDRLSISQQSLYDLVAEPLDAPITP